jgi:hypothetical protein
MQQRHEIKRTRFEIEFTAEAAASRKPPYIMPASTPKVVLVPHSSNPAFISGDMATSCLRHNQKQFGDIPDEDLHTV